MEIKPKKSLFRQVIEFIVVFFVVFGFISWFLMDKSESYFIRVLILSFFIAFGLVGSYESGKNSGRKDLTKELNLINEDK